MVAKGDALVTAGTQRGTTGSLYPRGITIGRVSYVGHSDTETYKLIQIEPAVDFGALDAVVVLIPKGEDR